MAWWMSFIHLTWTSNQRWPLIMLQDALTLFQNLFHTVLMAGSSIFKQVRQSPEANSKSESATFSLNSSWVDSSPLWSVLFLLLCSLVLLEAPMPLLCTFGGILGSPAPWCAVPTAGFGFSGFSMGFLPRLIVGCTIWGVIQFACCRLTSNLTIEHPTGGVPIQGKYDRGRMGGAGVSEWYTGLCIGARACELSDPGAGVTARASAASCMVVVNASPRWCMEITSGLAGLEIHQSISLTELARLMSGKTLWEVPSTSSAILAHWSSCWVAILVCQSSYLVVIWVCWSSYLLASPSHSRACSHSSLALAQVMHCSHVRTG